MSHTTTDSPILPAQNLRQLHEIDPSLVGWVVNQTEVEAAHRRKQDGRINTFIFAERIGSIVAGAVVAIFGLGCATYLILNHHDWAGALLGGGTLVAIVSTLIAAGKRSEEKPQPRRTASKRKK